VHARGACDAKLHALGNTARTAIRESRPSCKLLLGIPLFLLQQEKKGCKKIPNIKANIFKSGTYSFGSDVIIGINVSIRIRTVSGQKE
jgi:hypothetical protein